MDTSCTRFKSKRDVIKEYIIERRGTQNAKTWFVEDFRRMMTDLGRDPPKGFPAKVQNRIDSCKDAVHIIESRG